MNVLTHGWVRIGRVIDLAAAPRGSAVGALVEVPR